jgi:hypothetical protein
MIGETASSETGGSKADWITNAPQRDIPQKFPSIQALVWFDWHFDATTGCHARLVVGRLLQIGPDRQRPATRSGRRGSRRGVFQQYCPDRQYSLCRLDDLPATDLTNAFVPE